MKFVKLATLYVRPEDIVHFLPNTMIPTKTTVKFRDGTEWTVNMLAEDIAALLNEAQP